jgi:hypothetical protein
MLASLFSPLLSFRCGLSWTGEAIKHVKLLTVDLLEQLPLTEQGVYLTVGQKALAGFSSDESLLFVRKESVDLWNALEAALEKRLNISVSGPPGTGKSTETWGWALWRARTKKIKVTWFHFSKKRSVKVVVDGASGQITSGHSAEIRDIKRSAGALLVIDGVTKQESVAINRACCAWRQEDDENRRFVTVSSVSVTVALEQNDEAKIVEFTVGSWTLEQYERACDDQKFYDSVKENLRCPGFDQKELLVSKYDLAGGCARWMFEFNHAKWLADFTMHLNKVNDYNLIFDEVGGDEAQIAVNHLRGVTVLSTDGNQEKMYFFISKYTVRELAKKCNDKRKFLVTSYEKAARTKNPAFGGWIFEFDVDYQLQDACDHKTEFQMQIRVHQDEKDDCKDRKERRPVSRYVEFASAEDLCAPIQQLATGQVLWAKPALWCQKGYDFICLWKMEGGLLYMLAANASHAKKHSVLLNAVSQLVRTLGKHDCVIEAIRFDFLVPSDAQFEVGQVEGNLYGWKNLTDVKWPITACAATYVAGSFIAVADVAQTRK